MDQLHRSFPVLLEDVQLVLTQKKFFFLFKYSLQVFYPCASYSLRVSSKKYKSSLPLSSIPQAIDLVRDRYRHGFSNVHDVKEMSWCGLDLKNKNKNLLT